MSDTNKHEHCQYGCKMRKMHQRRIKKMLKAQKTSKKRFIYDDINNDKISHLSFSHSQQPM